MPVVRITPTYLNIFIVCLQMALYRFSIDFSFNVLEKFLSSYIKNDRSNANRALKLFVPSSRFIKRVCIIVVIIITHLYILPLSRSVKNTERYVSCMWAPFYFYFIIAFHFFDNVCRYLRFSFFLDQRDGASNNRCFDLNWVTS